MRNIELTVLTNSFGSELVSQILTENGSEGVAIYDSSDIADLIKSDVIWDYIDEKLLEKNEIVTVKGYYPLNGFEKVYPDIVNELERLKERSANSAGSLEISQTEIDDENWLEVWKQYYKPIKIGRLVIVPKWLKYESKNDERIVFIDPGMAFGTGEHESTRLCLSMLEELDIKGKTVLDIGTGSGILGLAAAKSGAKKVVMSDIDPIAVKAAKSNAECNDLSGVELSIIQGDLTEKGFCKGDIVLANITADILIRLSSAIGGCVNGGGVIIVSGIIKSRRGEVLQAFENNGFLLDKSLVMGEWCGMRFTAPKD